MTILSSDPFHPQWFDLSNPDRPVRGETYSGKDRPSNPGGQRQINLLRRVSEPERESQTDLLDSLS